MRRAHLRLYGTRLVVPLILCMAATAIPLLLLGQSAAAQLSFRSLQLSDGTVTGTNVTYAFSFNTNTNGPLGSLAFQVCSNYQYFPSDPCTTPTGFSDAGVVLASQSGPGDFSLSPASTANRLLVVRPAATPEMPEQLKFSFAGITNPSIVGSNFVRISTYAATDGSGPETDYGVVVFAINQSVTINTEVPPYLLFCTGVTITGFSCSTAAGSSISFGELSSAAPRSATSQLLASTNAAYGYSVTLAGTTMTAGTNVIPAMAGSNSQPGTSQFGLNSRQNLTPAVGSDPTGPGLIVPTAPYNTPDSFRFVPGDILATTNTSDDYRKLTISYLVNVNSGQPPGHYVATVSYICLANF